MSRSYRKNPAGGVTTCQSEKQDKRRGNRSYRKRVRMAILCNLEVMPVLNEFYRVWNMGKDGKRWYGWDNSYIKRLLRK